MRTHYLALKLVALLVPTVQVCLEAAAMVDVQARIDQLQASGKPVVVHVVVALCDNLHQGIVPVPAALGNGQDPRSNLYWGALYGVRTHLQKAGFDLLDHASDTPDGVLERVVLAKSFDRFGEPVRVVVVADAWDGSEIEAAIDQFLRFSAGRDALAIPILETEGRMVAFAGGAAAVVAFVGHNGLMDFELSTIPPTEPAADARASIVLACASKAYFLASLREGGSYPLLLTTGLMAPEAYTLVAAVKALVTGGDSAQVHEAASQAYQTYQNCGIRGARRLFYVE